MTAVLVLVACGSDTAAVASRVPFKLDPVTRPPDPGGEEAAPPGTPPCTVDDLVVDGPNDRDHLPMPPQQGALIVTIQAPASDGCALDRWPMVTADGSLLPDNGWDDDRPAVLLAGRRQVIGFVHLPTRCDTGAELWIGYPDGTSSQYSAPPSGCGEGMSPDDVVSGWMSWNQDPPDTPFDSLTLELDDLPKTIEHRLLQATLVLGNPTDQDVPLEERRVADEVGTDVLRQPAGRR